MNVVIKVDEKTKEKMIKYYTPLKRDKEIPYVILQAKDEDTTITMYESNKVMFQGVSADVDAAMWSNIQEIEENKKNVDTTNYLYTTAIGSDEVGTGDYFGPIVVTATLVKKDQVDELLEIGVGDSKKLTDDLILEIVPKFIKKIKYESVILNNTDYNKIHNNEYNLNKIKAILHNKVLLKMMEDKPNIDYLIVDEFAREKRYYDYLKTEPKIQKGITFVQKAEDKNLSVAAASLISRYIFLKEFDKLSKSVNKTLPKGAGKIVDEVAKDVVREHGEDILKDIAKMNFLNTERILKDL